jgi:hypothetical protein
MRFTVNRVLGDLRSASVAPLLVAAAGLLVALLGSVSIARASSSCPNELFRTGPGANLPDCRAYEMVSPAEKNGGEVDGGPVLEGNEPAPQQAALNGEAVAYGSQTTFTEANPSSSPLTSEYLSRRGQTGWYTQAVTPEQDIPGGVFNDNQGSVEFSLFQGFSEDLSHAFLLAYEPSPVAGAPAKYFNPYVRDNLDSSYRLLSTVKPPVVPPGIAVASEGLKIEYAGMSRDGSHVVFSANDALTPGALPGKENLYEWSDGQLELVSVLPMPGGTAVSSTEGQLVFGQPALDQGGLNEDYQRVISANGSRVIWSYFENYPTYQVYMHELTTSGARTVHVSASQKTNGEGPGGVDPKGPLPALYQIASVDGSEIFFTSCEKLTNDSTAGPSSGDYSQCTNVAGRRQAHGEERVGEDLYRYETSTSRLTDLTVDSVPGQTANVINVLGASEDGSYVYFVAHGALVEGAPSGPSSYNIYLWHNGVISLITTTGSNDYSDGGGSEGLQEGSSFIKGEHLLEAGASRVSPDGRYLAVESSEPLTGYDNKPLQAGACKSVTSFWAESVFEDKTGRCVEVYEYDAGIGRLTCASCNPRGLPPVGDSVVPMAVHNVVENPGWQSSTVQQRYLLDNGRLFFDSTDVLLPQASNGKLNVYEYEPGGMGSCQREGGCIWLISSGTSNENSYFTDASTSGNDVFFITRQQLVAQDGDEALDVYDARVDGGFLAPPTPPCGGEACRPPVTPAPAIYEAPPSATFVGPGNPLQPAVQPTAGKAKQKSKRKHKAKRKTGKRASRGSRARRSSRGSRR